MKVVEYGNQNAKVVMLLHGGGLSWWNFRAEAEVLREQYHVILPILDGHSDSDNDFVSIEENAERIISFIDEKYGGSIMLLGGLSLGAQILTEILAQRKNICKFAIVESASILPSKITNSLIEATVSPSYALIQQKWFSQYQFKYLKINQDLFEDYYRDSCKITKKNMISFLKASTSYKANETIKNTEAKVRIVVGQKEQRAILKSAQILHEMLTASDLEVKAGLYHGEYSLNHPNLYVEELLKMISK
jgi:pimeloyl-ACP methyl ester carboxylesterase